MQLCLKIMVMLGVIVHFILPQSATATVNTSSLERLNWLCSDYQMTVKGFVVEWWFVLPDGIISDVCLGEMLGVNLQKEVNILSDNSTCRISNKHEKSKQYVELQLITTNIHTAIDYEKMWKDFALRYHVHQPVGTTILIEFPEHMNKKGMQELTKEILTSLACESVNTSTLENGYQAVAYSAQIRDAIIIGQEKVNINLAFQWEGTNTILYLGTPVIYQQY